MKKYLLLVSIICMPLLAYMQTINASALKYMGDGTTYSYMDFKNLSGTNVGGLMHNVNNSTYGNGDDLVMYTYGNRDLNFITGTGKIRFCQNIAINKTPSTWPLDVNGGIKWATTASTSLGTDQGACIELEGITNGMPYIDFKNSAGVDFHARIKLQNSQLLTFEFPTGVNGWLNLPGGCLAWGSTGAYLGIENGASIELKGTSNPFIDFSGPGTQDYDVRLIRSGSDLLSLDGGGLQINSGGNLSLISGNLQLNNGNIELTSIGKKLMFDPADLFTYNNTNSVGHQSLGWYDDSWNTLGKTMYLSGWAGLKFFTGGTPRLLIDNSGNVGIGITPSATVKLTVDGKIECEEVEVKNIGADFVFEDGYKLMTIAEVEKYIIENKHLPGIPAASETEKGIGLGQMNELLLQKVEEMQLYIIDLQKQIDELK